MTSKSLDLFMSVSLSLTKDYSFIIGKVYKAFSDLDITLYADGLTFQVEHNSNKSFSEYSIDDEKGLIIVLHSKLFSYIQRITNSNSCNFRIKILYSGIINYKLLFPYMNNENLLNRLALFYEEAEIAFQNKAWLSYALMAGAVFEGLLFDIVGKKEKFKNLIDDAYELKYINEQIKDTIDKTRVIRNLVHSNRYNEKYVEREDAYNIKQALDGILYLFEEIRREKLKENINERN